MPERNERGLLSDALEFHSNNHLPENAETARAAAQRLALPLVNTGDSHCLEMIGRFWIETNGLLERAEDIRQIILSGAYVNRSSDE